MGIARAYQGWRRAASNPECLEASKPAMLGALAAFVALLTGGLSAFETPRAWFDLSPRHVALAFLGMAAGWGPLMVLAHRRVTALGPWGGLAVVLALGSVQFFAASLMALSRYPAATVFSSFALLTAATHGRNARVTPRKPFVTGGLLAAMGGAWLLARSPEHTPLFLVTTLACVAAQWLTGSFVVAQDRAQLEADRMRAALQAQVWREQERQLGATGQALGQVHRSSEGLREALGDVGEALELAAALPAQRPEVQRKLQQGREGLRRMEALLASVGAASQHAYAPEPEDVELLPVLDAVLAHAALLHPDVRLERDGTGKGRVRVSGGVITLRRILENLLLNACEGDGTRGARHVRVGVSADVTGGRMCVDIEDDGPGFTPQQLAEPILPLTSGKPKAQGLGLYTVEALVHCSGGRMERGNRPGGGAHVRVVLPREDSISSRRRPDRAA